MQALVIVAWTILPMSTENLKGWVSHNLIPTFYVINIFITNFVCVLGIGWELLCVLIIFRITYLIIHRPIKLYIHV